MNGFIDAFKFKDVAGIAGNKENGRKRVRESLYAKQWLNIAELQVY